MDVKILVYDAVNADEVMDKMEARIKELEKENSQLKQKLEKEE